MQVILKNVRVAFPNVFQATQFEGAGPFTYSLTALMPKDSEAGKLVAKTITEVAATQWKDKATAIVDSVKGNNQKCCFYPGELKEYDGFAGSMALACKRKAEDGHPKVIDQKMNELSSSDGKPYGGSYCHVKVDIWAQDNKWGKAIRSTLIAVQFVKDGDAFTATGPANTDGFQEEASVDSSDLI